MNIEFECIDFFHILRFAGTQKIKRSRRQFCRTGITQTVCYRHKYLFFMDITRIRHFRSAADGVHRSNIDYFHSK